MSKIEEQVIQSNDAAAIGDSETTPKKQFITTETKQNPDFQTQLANMARADAHHDLDEVFKRVTYENTKDTKIKDAFDEGIPASPKEYYDEPKCLESIILDIIGETIDVSKTDKIEKLRTVRDVTILKDTNIPPPEPSIVKIGIKGTTLFEYDVVQFIIPCNTKTNDNTKLTPYTGRNFGNDFFESTRLGGITERDINGTNASIIVDFSQHHFMEKLTEGPRNKNNNTIYYLMTPEVVNDPAGKTNIHNKSIFDKKTGVKLVSCLQTTPTPMSYTKYNEFETYPLNNFFSKYDFSLLPIKQVYTSAKNEKLISTLNINYDREDKIPFTDTIEDSKSENSITTVIGYLKTIINALISTKDEDNKANLQFNFNSKVQQKRGGDWFQVLSCLDAKNRTYTQILPDNNRRQIDNNVLGPVYFVTHDQIAVSYALLNGVNVIYIDYYGRIYVFKNRGDPIFAQGAIPIENLLWEGMKTYWYGNSGEDEELKNDCIKIYNTYEERRPTLINTYKDNVETAIANLSTEITKFRIDNDHDKNNLLDSLKKIFKNAVTLAFILDNFAPLNIDIEEIELNYNNLLKINIEEESNRNEFIEKNKNNIIKLNTDLNILKGLLDKFGDLSPYNAGGIFINWVDKNVKKLDVYRAIDKLDFYTYFKDKPSISKRFINLILNRKDKQIDKPTDMHIFLPYIQTLENDILISILDVLTQIQGKFQSDTNKLKETSRTSRSGKPDSNTIYLDNLLNFIYEANLLLNITKNESSEGVFQKNINELKKDIEAVGELQSSDNIIVNEDFNELKFLNTGKESTSTIFVPEPQLDIAVGAVGSGGGWSVLKNTSRGENVICDVSVKQITWQLLSCILLQDCRVDSLKEKLDAYINYIPDIEVSESNIDYLDEDKYAQKILKFIKDEEQKERYIEMFFTGGMVTSIVYNIFLIYYVIYHLKLGGGKDDDNTAATTTTTTTTTNLLQDFSMGYHPLMPIYMLLSPFYYTLGPKAQGNPFFYTYFTYFNILEKMVDVLENKYLNETSNKAKILAAYVIGFALRSFLFTSNTSTLQGNKILEVVGMPQEEFFTFSLKNDSFSNLIMGTFHSTPDEDIAAFILLDSELFNNFINNEVNIKSFIVPTETSSVVNVVDNSMENVISGDTERPPPPVQPPQPQDNNMISENIDIPLLPVDEPGDDTTSEIIPENQTYIALKEKVFLLLSRIASKINDDRAQHETIETTKIVASPQVIENVNNNEGQNMGEGAKGVPSYRPYINPAVEAQASMGLSNINYSNAPFVYGGKTKKIRKKQKNLNSKKNKKRNMRQQSKTRRNHKKKCNKNTKRFNKQ
jgi:hypothetical protein